MNCCFEELGALNQIIYAKEREMNYKMHVIQKTLIDLSWFSNMTEFSYYHFLNQFNECML